MGQDFFNIIYKAFGIIFALSFAIIILTVIFGGPHLSIGIILIAAVYLGLFVLANRFLHKHIKYVEKRYSIICLLAAVFLFTLQMFFTFILRFEPIFDLEAVYSGAIEWVEKGSFTDYTSSTCHSDYFYIFPNNLGTLCFFALIFKAANIFGITNYFALASVINGLMFSGVMVITSLICRRLFGIKSAVFAFMLFLLTPPFYFIAPVFYTDALSLIFPVAAFYLFLVAKDNSKLWCKIFLFSLSILLAALGALIKMTALIILIAIGIYLLITKSFKNLVIYLLISVSIVAMVFVGFNGYMYSSYLDKDKADSMNTPIYYWLDLGVHGDGRYNNEIFSLSRNTSDPDLRKELLKQDISSQVDDLGLGGILKLFSTKSAIAFGDGTFALSDFLDDNPQNISILHKYILYNGDYYGFYSMWCTGIFMAVLMLMVVSVGFQSPNKKSLVPQLCVFGIMLFLLAWEINSRYITTFIPFIFIAAADGAERLQALLEAIKSKSLQS